MKKVISIILSLVLLLTMSITCFAAETKTDYLSENKNTTLDDVLALEPYVVRNQDGTLSIDELAAYEAGCDTYAIDCLNHHFSVINPQILKGEISTDTDLNIINGEHIMNTHRCSRGTNSYSTHWWGYKRYACDCETDRIVSDLNTLASGSVIGTGAASLIGYIFPVTAAVAAGIGIGLTIDSGYCWLLATRIDANNNGRGTIINMTHVMIFDIEPQ